MTKVDFKNIFDNLSKVHIISKKHKQQKSGTGMGLGWRYLAGRSRGSNFMQLIFKLTLNRPVLLWFYYGFKVYVL